MGIDYSNGWDAVIAANFADIDHILNAAYSAGVTPHAGNGTFSIPVGPVQIPVTLALQMGPWTATGGSGQNVVFAVPLTGGTATVGSKTAAVNGSVLQLTVEMRFVNSTVSGGGTVYQLNVVLDDSAILGFAITNPPAAYTAEEVQALQQGCLDAIKTAMHGRVLTVGTLDLSSIAAQYPWLMPTHGLSYAAGSNSAAPGNGALAMLIASNNPPPSAPSSLLAGTIPSGSDSALVISNTIFCSEFLIPALASAIGASPSQFTLSGRNPATVVMSSGQGSGGGGTITSAQATAQDDVVSIQLQGNASPTSGVSVDFTINSTYAVQLAGTADNPTLIFQQTGNSESHSTSIAWWVYLVSGLSGGAVGIMVATLIGQIVNKLAGSSISGAMPSNFMRSFAWPFAGTVNVNHVALPTPLVLGGLMQGGA